MNAAPIMATITIAIATSTSVKPRRADCVVVMSAPCAKRRGSRRVGAVERQGVLFRRVAHGREEELDRVRVRTAVGDRHLPPISETAKRQRLGGRRPRR